LSHPDQVSGNKRGSVYDQITERIIALLERGTVPWRKPWKAQFGLPRNPDKGAGDHRAQNPESKPGLLFGTLIKGRLGLCVGKTQPAWGFRW
jgi:hypothetical protein